ncbi:hypothetical protein [Devosia sp. Root635]|uniref:hypothetical protein n=1 Tax=Devosia sp. Root635 TaxID=1736575 RepID=UPI0006FE9C83|nr:hypothetical protein [Devosia sp. Root635]KRA44705.1 hypothetical protein ASD80_06065 [Devosia sp. Root635]
MHGYSIYRISTGEIVPGRSGWCSEYRDVVAQPISEDEACFDQFLEGRELYIVGQTATPRPVLHASAEAVELVADGVDSFAIEPVPPGTRVSFRGEWHVIDDGLLIITIAVPGPYDLVLEPPFPFQHQNIRINAHAP